MKKITVALIIIQAIALSGCGIFDPKSPEYPDTGGGTPDPLNIADILSIVRGESSVDMDYRDYFTNDVEFIDAGLHVVRGRDHIIHMLNRLRALASFVVWETEKGVKSQEGNRYIIRDVPYIVYARDGNIYTGFADFHIIREIDWVISYWKDMPADGSIPFFEQ